MTVSTELGGGLSGLFGLHGKTAVVTGAVQGIGLGIARTLAMAGARVVVGDLRGEAAEAAAARLRDEGAEVLGVAVDVSEEESVTAMFSSALAAFGGMDILVNNAGIYPKTPFLELTVAQWDRIHAVNLRGTFLCMREAIRHMKAAGRGGAIVNISSVNSLQPVIHDNAQYGSSKAGVNMLTRTAALEFAPDGIRVNAVLPGGVATEGAAQSVADRAPTGPLAQPGRMPLGRIGEPADIAAAVLFLSGPGSSYITGQLLAVDGGFQVS
ncbi:3-oxoacyl-[acyl-carrier-protein] reductase (plasmid) [Azospirillum sp. B510]|uniref:SDR family NAD(P)-dependent oxidoreductase n=1 Tax=Azospirillum sp. (strain B510) TaxID=137722 RepID=UPI0001C4CB82|nr:SDR family NAD(P)-dependent oxidoreductase [Azospirillum sp. B510]BAI74818.1 3-oxoacyl-[acyl-carrier-protein] reductase [Azospirillum sp. B510]